MGAETDISFAHHTWSPWRGCEHARMANGIEHPGCKNCYAEAMSGRNPAVLGEWGPQSRRAIAVEKYWRLPYAWNEAAKKAGERRRVFPSLMDPFEDREDLRAHRARMFTIIDECPHLDFLLFTKRPDRIWKLWTDAKHYRKNVWLLYSASDQVSLDSGVSELLKCRELVPVLGISAEPLVGPLNVRGILMQGPYPGICGHCKRGHGFTRCPNYGGIETKDAEYGCEQFKRVNYAIDWVIVGGESGPYARACELDWIRAVVAQCRSAYVPVFVKQLGSYSIYRGRTLDAAIYGKKGEHMEYYTPDLRYREYPHADKNNVAYT